MSTPDINTFVLPGWAYLRSIADQNIPMRRAALSDARRYFDRVEGTDFDRRLALVGLVGDALQVLEDVAALGNAFLNSPSGVGFYAVAATYEPNAINRFYEGLRKRSMDDFLRLAALRFGDDWIHDHIVFSPRLTDEEQEAVRHAHRATARLLRGYLEHLREPWEQLRNYFHAFKHGMLVVDPRDARVVEADRVTEVDQIVVWRRKRVTPQSVASIGQPFESVADYAEQAGHLAADTLEHLVLHRLRIFDLPGVVPDGSRGPGRTTSLPWIWWLHEGDLEEREIRLLEARFPIVFSGPDDIAMRGTD